MGKKDKKKTKKTQKKTQKKTHEKSQTLLKSTQCKQKKEKNWEENCEAASKKFVTTPPLFRRLLLSKNPSKQVPADRKSGG
jgi:hypothetical protein